MWCGCAEHHHGEGVPTVVMNVIVLSHPAGVEGEENPFIGLLLDSMPADVDVRGFTWRRALLGQYDVLHLHWPEQLLRGATKARSSLKSVLFFLLLLRLAG